MAAMSARSVFLDVNAAAFSLVETEIKRNLLLPGNKKAASSGGLAADA
jgi:hypothetical protein